MNQRHKLAFTVMGVLLVFGVTVASVCAAPSAASERVLRATLDNGLRVVIVRDALAPVVTTQITYRAGGYETAKGFPGTAHALEHMLFRDSTGLSGAQLNELTGKMGARNNAFTTSDATQYYFVAPSRYTDLLLKIESIRMRGATLSSKDWSVERGAIEQEVSRDISDPDFLAYVKARQILFEGTGYANSPLGTRPTFGKTTSADLKKFYDHWYQPNNAVLVVVGDVKPKAVLDKVKALFGAIPKASVPARAPITPKPFQSQTITRTTPDATGTVEYIYRLPGQHSKDYAAVQVLMTALDNARSRLSDLAASGKVLSSSAGTQSFTRGGMGFIGVGFPKGGDADKAKAYLDGVIADVLKQGVAADLVAAAKRHARADYEFSRNSAVSLASAWSQALAWQGVDSPREALDKVLAVTPQDVDRVARKYLTPDQRVTVVLTPSATGKRPPHSQGFGGTEKFASNDKLNVPLPDWATQALAKLQMPKWTLDPVRMHLDNGITLIVQPESVSKTVTVAGHIDTNEDLQAPKGQEGVGNLLDSLFDYGTVKLDRTAFHQALDEIAATEWAGTSFGIAVPSQSFDRGMQLLAANMLHPALPQSAFEVQQQSLARRLKGRLESPRYKMMRALHEGLYPAGDPALRQATPATVNRLSLADVKGYYAAAYRPDMTTIVVVGDVAPQQAKALVEKYFGAWQASGPKPDVVLAPVPPNAAHYVVVPNTYASQDQVLLAHTVDLNLHDPARYALRLGNMVLGGNGFASRLMADIRVKHGYAYGVGSGLDVSRSRAVFYVGYGSDPSKVASVDALVQRNIKAMRTTPVKASELANARQALIRSIPLTVSSVRGIADSLLAWSYTGQPLDEPMVAARHYLNLDAAEVQAAFQKYIHPDRMVQVIQGPAPKAH